MKRLLCVALILVSLSSSLLLSSCQKQADVEASLQDQQAAITVAEAEAWFSNTVVKKEKEMLAQTYTVVPEKSSSRLFARMAKLQHKLLWQDAEVVNKQGLQFMVVPVTANKQLKSSEYELSRAFVFYKNKDNKMSMNVVELMSEKGKTLDGKSGDIIAAAFYNRMAATKETVPGVNATVFFYNDAYQSLSSYEMKNGVWASANTNLQITNSATELKSTESISTEADGCTRWYVVRFNFEDGALVSWEILYSYLDCPPGSGGNNTDPQTEDPYGGGGANNLNLDAEIAAFKANYEINSASEAESSELVSETSESRNKKYIWTCGKGLLVRAVSVEHGTHKKVNGEWRWESLTHQSLDIHGFVAGGSVSVSSHTGQATLGLYHAIMDVTYTLHYNLIIPSISPINWSANKSAAKAWNVNE